MRKIRVVAAALLVCAASTARADEPRAPARVKLHKDAQAGDWLERVSSTKDGVVRERWTYLGERDGKMIAEVSGPTWPGVVLELAFDATGKVVEAKAAPPGKQDELKPIAIATEPPPFAEKTEADEDVMIAAGVFHCRRVMGERQGERRWRWVALDGPANGYSVKEHMQTWDGKAWRESMMFAAAIKNEAVDVSGKSIDCLKLVKRITVAGAKQPDTTEWIARTPVHFGERVVKAQTATANVLLYWGAGGKSALVPPPKPAPPPPEPKKEEPKKEEPRPDAPPSTAKKEEPAKPADAPKPSDAPKPAAGGEWVDVPGFDDVKVGQRYVFKMPNGMTQEWEIAEKGETAFTVKLTTIVNGKAIADPSTSPMPFRVKKGDDKPPEMPKPIGKETLKVAGQDWECDVYEGTPGPGTAKMKQWLAKKFPFSIKTEIDGEPKSELVDVTTKPSDAKPADKPAEAPAKPEESAKGDAPKPADPPKPADAGGEWVDLPGYEDVKVGQKYVYKMSGGATQEWEVLEKTESAWQVKMTSIMNGTSMGSTTPMPYRVKKGEGKPADAPKPVGKETVKAAGIDWECEIFETDAGGMKMKTWTAKKFPFTIRTEMNGAPTMELAEIK